MQIRIRIKERGDYEEQVIEPGPWQIVQMERRYGADSQIGVEQLAFLAYLSTQEQKGQLQMAKFNRYVRSLDICEVVPVRTFQIECGECGEWAARSFDQAVRDTVRWEENQPSDDDDDDETEEDDGDPKAN